MKPVAEPDDRRSPADLMYGVVALCEASQLDHDLVSAVLHKVLASLSVMTQSREDYLQRSAYCFDMELVLNPQPKEVH